MEFHEFMAARGPALLRTAYLLTGNREEAEDLLQGSMATLLVHWRRVGHEHPEAYVRRIIVNAHLTRWRRLRQHETPVDSVPDRVTDDHTTSYVLRDEMWSALARLPRRQRAVLVLRFYEDLSERETAETLGCSVGTVKSQTAKAIAKLRAEMSPQAVLPLPAVHVRKAVS